MHFLSAFRPNLNVPVLLSKGRGTNCHSQVPRRGYPLKPRRPRDMSVAPVSLRIRAAGSHAAPR